MAGAGTRSCPIHSGKPECGPFFVWNKAKPETISQRNLVNLKTNDF